jgi:hypothetical protein
MGALTLAMPSSAILRVADINSARCYYHYSDMPKYAHDYNNLPSRRYYVGFCSSEICVYPTTMDELTSALPSLLYG